MAPDQTTTTEELSFDAFYPPNIDSFDNPPKWNTAKGFRPYMYTHELGTHQIKEDLIYDEDLGAWKNYTNPSDEPKLELSVDIQETPNIYRETPEDREDRKNRPNQHNIDWTRSKMREDVARLLFESNAADFSEGDLSKFLSQAQDEADQELIDFLLNIESVGLSRFKFLSLGNTAEELKDKWRKDVFEGTSSEETSKIFEDCEDNVDKDCLGECGGSAYKDAHGECCRPEDRDCNDRCFGKYIETVRYSQNGFQWKRCCNPDTDTNCCPPEEWNCMGVCPNGPDDPISTRYRDYIEIKYKDEWGRDEVRCCNPKEDPTCCPPGEWNMCYRECGVDGPCKPCSLKFTGWEEDFNGLKQPKCCDPSTQTACCTDEFKKCGFCPGTENFDNYIEDGINGCCDSTKPGCCTESESHCGKCQKDFAEHHLWTKHVETHIKNSDGTCTECATYGDEVVCDCETDSKLCDGTICPGDPNLDNYIVHDDGSCCQKGSENCCAESEKDCAGTCNGRFIKDGDQCCDPREDDCCETARDCAGECGGHNIQDGNKCCDPRQDTFDCCEQRDCCGTCTGDFQYNENNKCVTIQNNFNDDHTISSEEVQCPNHN